MDELNKIINDAQEESIKNLDKAKEILNNILPEEHQCNFCDSTDTTEFSAEGEGSVWLCEDCRNIGSGESADL